MCDFKQWIRLVLACQQRFDSIFFIFATWDSNSSRRKPMIFSKDCFVTAQTTCVFCPHGRFDGDEKKKCRVQVNCVGLNSIFFEFSFEVRTIMFLAVRLLTLDARHMPNISRIYLSIYLVSMLIVRFNCVCLDSGTKRK